MKNILVLLLLVSSIVILQATEIYGVIDEDTTIGPEGNPWYVTHNLTVNEDAALIILPGTEIYITAVNSDDFWNFAETGGGEADAKVITIYGSITAVGTESDSILFTRYPNTRNYRWGGIRMNSQNPEVSHYRHCIVEYTAFYSDGASYPSAGISSNIGIDITDCRFKDNYRSIRIYSHDIAEYPSLIYNCSFFNSGDKIIYYGNDSDTDIQITDNDYNISSIVARCSFHDCTFSSISGRNDFVFNTFNHIRNIGLYNNQNFYGNYLENCTSSFNSIRCDTLTAGVFRKNHLEHIHLSGIDEYKDISANKFNFFTDLDFDVKPDSRFYNNTSENSGMTIYCNYDSAGTQNIYNNFMYESSISGDITIGDYNYFNNILFGDDVGIIFHLDSGVFNGYNNYTDKWSLCAMLEEGEDTNYYNNIFNDVAGFIENNSYRYNRYFYNNFLTYNMPDFITDCGGNLEDMDIALAGVLIDTLNHTFALSDSSLCIDAGYEDTTFCNWDYSYNYSPFDGDGDGIAVVDIGPVEYGSYFTIGYVKCTVSDLQGVPLDIIRGEVAGECVEYTGLDGSFVMALPGGTYNLILDSPFYQQDSIFVAVNVADTSYVNMSLEATYPFVGSYEDELSEVDVISNVLAYPNPFNPETKISFELSSPAENVTVSIYNIKGQKVWEQELLDIDKGKQEVIWTGQNRSGRQVASGVYLYRVKAGKEKKSAKMLYLK
ncbi:MAG: FlgD immunoglobulin-like domain containing protein [Candidatus Stygibacter australis]|nr:FlgD immunoglobulin-like domain containing protein [Candidatus Stygibacter australis]